MSVMKLHRARHAVMASLLLTYGEAAMRPRSRAATVKTRVKAGPANTSYSTPVAE